jgi:hypothetical protein
MKRLQQLPPKNNGGTYKGGAVPEVDWDKLVKGGVWLAHRGTDFNCATRTFASRLYQAARRHRMTVAVRLLDNAVAFQFQKSYEKPRQNA